MKAIALIMVMQLLIACTSNDPWQGKIARKDGITIIENTGRGTAGRDHFKRIEVINIFGAAAEDSSLQHNRFGRIVCIDFDQYGNIYALDRFDETMYKMDSNGVIIRKFARKGQAPGELESCTQFYIQDEYILCGNAGNNRVEIFNLSGTYIKSIPVDLTVPQYLFPGNNGFYYGHRRLSVQRPILAHVDTINNLHRPVIQGRPFNETMDILRNMARVRPASNGFWVVYSRINCIEFYDLTGALQFESYRKMDWLLRNTSGNIIPELPSHGASCVTPDGSLYFICQNREKWEDNAEVHKYDSDGRYAGMAFTLPVDYAGVIALDDKGFFYFSDGVSIYKSKIYKQEADG